MQDLAVRDRWYPTLSTPRSRWRSRTSCSSDAGGLGQHRIDATGAGSVRCLRSVNIAFYCSYSSWGWALAASIGRYFADHAVSLLGCISILVLPLSSFLSPLESQFHKFPYYNMTCLFDVHYIRCRPHHCNTYHQVYYFFLLWIESRFTCKIYTWYAFIFPGFVPTYT